MTDQIDERRDLNHLIHRHAAVHSPLPAIQGFASGDLESIRCLKRPKISDKTENTPTVTTRTDEFRKTLSHERSPHVHWRTEAQDRRQPNSGARASAHRPAFQQRARTGLQRQPHRPTATQGRINRARFIEGNTHRAARPEPEWTNKTHRHRCAKLKAGNQSGLPQHEARPEDTAKVASNDLGRLDRSVVTDNLSCRGNGINQSSVENVTYTDIIRT